jgi:ATP-binding cassette subfamily C (CFTR/MRP) protein 1
MFVVITFVFQMAMFGQVLLVMGIRSAANLHHILVKTMVKAPMSFFETMDSSVLLNRFSQDMTLVDFQLPMSAFMVFLRMFGDTSINFVVGLLTTV